MEQYRKVPVMISGNQNLKKDVAKSPKQMFSRNIFQPSVGCRKRTNFNFGLRLRGSNLEIKLETNLL
jgi:hypothetical protein